MLMSSSRDEEMIVWTVKSSDYLRLGAPRIGGKRCAADPYRLRYG